MEIGAVFASRCCRPDLYNLREFGLNDGKIIRGRKKARETDGGAEEFDDMLRNWMSFEYLYVPTRYLLQEETDLMSSWVKNWFFE